MRTLTLLHASAVCLCPLALAAQQSPTPPPPPSHHDAVASRGDHAMGFSHETTTHHFRLYKTGGAIDVSVRDEVDGRVVAIARRQRNSDPLMEVNDRQSVLERSTFDAFDVAEAPQRPREQFGVRRVGNDGYGTRDRFRTV